MDPGNGIQDRCGFNGCFFAASEDRHATCTTTIFLERPDVAVQLGSGLWWKTGEEPPITKRKRGFLKNTLKSTDFQSSPISLGARESFSF